MKLVAGITRPTRGSLVVDGRVSALIELGAGFHPEISGRENVAINAIMLGLTRKQLERSYDAIVDFAELRDFIDAPVKTYSSGMYMRLGFAVAIHVDPDVLLIDEVLAVGDEAFTRKCLDKISEFRRRGKTILFVTHSLGLVEKMCDDVLWLNHGRTRGRGDPKRVVDEYLTYVAGGEEALLRSRSAADAAQAETAPATERARGRGSPGRLPPRALGQPRGRDPDVRLLDAREHERHVFVPGETLTLALSVHAARPVSDFVFGIGLFAADGTCVYGTNTDLEDWKPRRLEGDARGAALARGAPPRRGHLSRRPRRAQARRHALRLPARAALVPGQEPRQGRRHLPPRAPAGLSAAAPQLDPPKERGESQHGGVRGASCPPKTSPEVPDPSLTPFVGSSASARRFFPARPVPPHAGAMLIQ